MFHTTILAAVFVSAAAAQQSLLTLPFYGYDTQSVDASVIAVDSTATTLSLACPSGTDQNDCGLFPYQTLTVGPSTYNMYMSAEDFTGTQDCMTASNICVESMSGLSANFPGSSTTTYDETDVETFVVTVTAGVDKLSATTGTGPASTSAMATGTTTSDSLIVISGAATNTLSSSISSATATATTTTTATGSATSAATTTTNAAAAKGVAGPVMMAAGAGVGLLGWFL